jgi:hypothetical protein
VVTAEMQHNLSGTAGIDMMLVSKLKRFGTGFFSFVLNNQT